MLLAISDDVKRHYYDPLLHGIDWDAKVREGEAKVESADSLNRALSDVESVLNSLNDSHTFLIPPRRPYTFDYGFQMEMVGDRCYVTRVRPGSDAETKGLKPGDEIVTVNGYAPTREQIGMMEYVFWILRPQQGLSLAVRGVAGEERRMQVMAKFLEQQRVTGLSDSEAFDNERKLEDTKHQLRVRYAALGKSLLIVKFPEFLPVPDEMDSVVRKMGGYDAAVVDLRGNPGGSVDALTRLLGGMFENPVKIGDRVARKSTKTVMTEPSGHLFKGKLVVLIDSESASAAEIFARVVQLERRGQVIGDESAGKVMEAERFAHSEPGDTGEAVIVYGVQVTVADIVMTDGQSLERRGVVPDVAVLPTAADLANNRDPVLAKAAELLGTKLTPEDAGKLFPYEWQQD
jgi:carboxyl-terminal processing protease